MDSPQDSPSPAPTAVPRNIEEKLGVFNLRVVLMILSFVNEKFQESPPSLMEHLLKLKRDSDNYSGIINYTFKRLKVDPDLFFTPDPDTVELPSELAAGIELRLALVDFLLSLNDEQAASRAIKKIAEGSSLLVLEMTPLEIIKEVCMSGSVEDVVSISSSVAAEFNRGGFFDHLRDPADWLRNVNYLLRKESNFSSSEEIRSNYLFMINQVFNSDYITKERMFFLRKHPKGAIFCILVPISLLTLLLVGVAISLWLSYHSPIATDQSMEIGDKQSSSALIPEPNNVSSVSLNIPSGVTVLVASSKPPTGTQVLQSEIPSSYGHCGPYNVNNGNHPVYLVTGSIMNYDITVSASNLQCPAKLVLLNNRTEYLACNYNSSSVVKAYCLTSGTVNHVSIVINKSANYYVILVKEDLTISVSSDITVHQVYYNTSNLTSANDCEQSDAPSCIVHNDDIKKWSCSNTEWYVILQSSSNVVVEYDYNTPLFNYCFFKMGLIITSVVIFVSKLLIGLIELTCYCFWTQRRKNWYARSRRNRSFPYYNTFRGTIN